MKVQDVIQELHQLRDENYLFDLTSSRSTTSLYSFIGVPYHVVKKVAKRIRRHYNLAADFWNQPYYESKQLSFLITNASVISEKHIDKHIVELHDDFLIDKFIAYVVLPSKYAKKKARQWTKSKDPFLVRLGYQLIAEMAKTEDNIDFDYAFYLDQIAKSILLAGNDIKLAMNQALISIGMNKDELYTKALDITKQLGKLRDSETKKMLKCPDALTLLNSAKTRAKFKVEF